MTPVDVRPLPTEADRQIDALLARHDLPQDVRDAAERRRDGVPLPADLRVIAAWIEAHAEEVPVARPGGKWAQGERATRRPVSHDIEQEKLGWITVT